MTEPTDLPENLPDERLHEIAQQKIAEHTQNAPVPETPGRRSVWRQWPIWALIACLLAMFALMVWAKNNTNDKFGAQGSQISQQASKISTLSSALADANGRIESLGGTPVTAPVAATGARGATGAQGPGPSDVQVISAVDYYCALHDGCVGTPSRAQVLAAVTSYCQVSTNPCTGAAGASGAAGQSGAAGASGAPGGQGPGPTDDQVATAVAAYCDAHNGCAGATGPSGAAGASGASGRGITSIDCTGHASISFVIHYDDGTSDTVQCTPQPSDSSTPLLPTPTPS